MPDECGPVERDAAPAPTPATAAATSTRRDAWLEIALVLLIAWLPAVYFGIGAYARRSDPSPSPLHPDLLLGTLRDAGTIGLILYLNHRAGWSWRSLGFRRPRLVDLAAGIALAWMCGVVSRATSMSMHACGLWQLLGSLLPAPPDLPPFAEVIDSAWFLPHLAISILFEELLFRSYLISRLRPLLGPARAVLASSVLFGVPHIYQGAAFAMVATVLGAFFALLMRLGGLPWAFLAHFLYDLWLSGLLDFLRP